MASRQEEKEARRRARIEQEEAERRSATRKRRLQVVLGGVLGAGIIAAVVVAVLGSGGDGARAETTARTAEPGAALPEPVLTDVKEAAAAANCELSDPADEGRGHDERTFTAEDYQTNPPTSGTHFPSWAQDGIYEPASTPPLGELVHTLEHGRIDVQYKPGTDPKLVAQLETFVAENEGYHMLLFQNPTGMKAQVAATAWTHSMTCEEPGPKMWDALRTFRDAHLDRGPEKIA